MSHKFALDVVLNTFVAIIECLNEICSESGDKKAGSEVGSSLLQKTYFDLLAASFLVKKKNIRKLFHIDQRNRSKLF